MTTETPSVRIELVDRVAIITLDRPQALNALSRALRVALTQAIAELSADTATAVIVFTGAGRAFCAGLDLKELATDGLGRATSAGEDPVRAVLASPKPVIAAVNGVAVTGGFELALACDVLIASTRARFADTHARVGILPGWGLSQRLSQLIGPYRAKELSLSGNFIDASTALAWGLVNRVTAPQALMEAALTLAQDMAQIPAGTLAEYKRIIDDGYALSLGESLALETERSGAHNRTVTSGDVAARRAEVQTRGRLQ